MSSSKKKYIHLQTEKLKLLFNVQWEAGCFSFLFFSLSLSSTNIFIMKTLEISVKKRTATGKADTKKLRKQEMVPCELYGLKEENLHFYAHRNAFKDLVYTPDVFLVKLNIDGEEHDAIMKAIQFHPVTDAIIHIDFLRISAGTPLKMRIPVRITGKAKGVAEGGILLKRARNLRILALPKHLPDFLEVDITPLKIGDSIKVRDLEYENIELLDSPNSVICSVKTTRMQATSGDEDEEDEEGAGEADEAAAAEAKKEE